ncbi:MAG: hypothetical protein CFE24_00990 [Flavobacterium sp. BFFFF2]|nr:MAG: hypothetical protein CFE24_00990 [Flavobacterium sp. BFFFF2]
MKTICCCLLLPTLLLAQLNKHPMNLKGKWFFGADVGSNNITSFYASKPEYDTFQAGVMAEYYYKKKWSVLARIKYFETGLSYSYYGKYNVFKGAVFAIPIDLKYEFKLLGSFRIHFQLGLAYNYETKSDYLYNYDANTNNATQFISINSGMGLSWYLTKDTAIYGMIDIFNLGGKKGNTSNWIVDSQNYYANNNLLSIGIKQHFGGQ